MSVLSLAVTFNVTVEAAQSVIQAIYSSENELVSGDPLETKPDCEETVYVNPQGSETNYLVVTFSESITPNELIEYGYGTDLETVDSVVYEVYSNETATVNGQVYLPIKLNEDLILSNYYKININDTVTFCVYQN